VGKKFGSFEKQTWRIAVETTRKPPFNVNNMKTYFGRMVLLVQDYDEALAFYQENFRCKILFDHHNENGSRYLHIGFDNADNTGIWLLKPDTTGEEQLTGHQTGGQPTFVLYTDDILGLYHHLQKNNVTIRISLINTPEYQFFHCLDLYENEIIVVQLQQ